MAFYRMDQSKVADYPQVNIATRSTAYEPDKYPMAGEQSHDVTVGIYDLNTKKTIYLDTPKSNDTKLPYWVDRDLRVAFSTHPESQASS